MFKKVTVWYKLSVLEQEITEVPLVAWAAGKKLCFIRGIEGISAIEEKCPHNGFSLAGGKVTPDGSSIVCPLHRYAYDLKSGRCSHPSGGVARIYPVESREDGLYIGVQETRWGF